MKTAFVTLKVTHDESNAIAPENWDLHELIGLGPDESVEVMSLDYERNAVADAAQIMLVALKAITAAWDKREDDYVPGLQAALQLAEDAIEIAEGRTE